MTTTSPWWDGVNEAEDLPWAVGQIKERFQRFQEDEEEFYQRCTDAAWEEEAYTPSPRDLRALFAARGGQERGPRKGGLARQDRVDGKELSPTARTELQAQLRRHALIRFLMDTLADTLEPFLLEEGAQRLAALRAPREGC